MFQSNFDYFFGIAHYQNRPGACEVENRARMSPFCTRNIHTIFGVQLLLFPVSIVEKCISQIFLIFSCPDTTETGLEQEKLKIGHR